MDDKQEAYRQLIERAKRLNLTEAKSLGVLQLPDIRGADGRPIVVMSPGLVDIKRLQDKDFVERLKCFFLLSLDDISKVEYNVVLFATKMKFSFRLFHFLFSEVYSILPRPYKKNIKSLFVIHAPDSAKAFFRFVLFMVSRKFWKKVHYLPCVAALAAELEAKEDIKSFVPRFVVAHEVRHAPKLQRLAEAYAITKAKADAKKAASAASAAGGGGGGAKPPGLPAPAPVQPAGAVFGQPLAALESNQHGVPLFLIQLESLLQKHALGQEGLFRIPPPQDDLNHAQKLIDSNKTPTFFAAPTLEPEEVNIIGTLYKLFFRRLPEPLIPFDKYDALITAQSSHEEEVIVRGIEGAVISMPREHRNTLLHLVQFLTLVAVQSQSNKMGMSNLALIFAPSILRSSDLNPLLELSSIKARVEVVQILFNNLDRLEQLDVYKEVRRPAAN
eukprot:CAMPEP_0195510588 /NCGR_PEP_ID=MMETSP0794_2-20130614/3196_1 /TAXON_ID=515487 /ORGANISM="Stephanopyxis turris, Strain CCMP 815" /LENGTH=443 /DNA_ID=CAMNT_0040638039 /DNA_START=126 /DNA_END=1457 /DNA_ORIENTATION=+